MEQVEHTAADHPELDDPAYLKELVHALLHRIEALERLVGDGGQAPVG